MSTRVSTALTMSCLTPPRVLLLTIFQLLVERADRADAFFSLLFSFELKRHGNFFKLVPFERKRIAALGLTIEHVEHGIFIF